MKNKMISAFVATLCIGLSGCGSEQSWLQTKASSLIHQMLSRHTYEYNSLEHIRDRALLFLFPAPLSRAILLTQRCNMENFLKKNEADAIEGLKHHFKVDQEKWDLLLTTFKQEQEFNLNAMKQIDTNIGHHDQSIPQECYQAIKREAQRYGINDANINFNTSKNPDSYGHTSAVRPDNKTYTPPTIELNIPLLSKHNTNYQHTITHEFTHLIRGHSLLQQIIEANILRVVETTQKARLIMAQETELKEKHTELFGENVSIIDGSTLNDDQKELILKKELLEKEKTLIYQELLRMNARCDDYDASKAKKAFKAATEKIADTLVACQDKDAAENAFLHIQALQKIGRYSYPANHNDIKVIYANWRTSQAISNFEQFKNSTKEKIVKLKESLRSVITG